MSPNLQMFAQDCSEEELRAVCKELFIAQRHYGITRIARRAGT
jgi:hypothetical protein